MAPVFEDTSLSCPSCGHGTVQTTYIEHKFSYGDGDRSVELSANVPLRRCPECGVEFFDSVAEELQHEAVCRHLGVMTPAEVRAVRQKTGSLSRGEFARITRLGEATIGRWERGELIQNAANDQLLYLLTFTENLERLRDRIEKPTPVSSPPVGSGVATSGA
jgi:putative zinc finger/helix-turn-helix YgiT family protein